MGWFELYQHRLYVFYACVIGFAGVVFGLSLTFSDAFVLCIIVTCATFAAPVLELPLNDEPKVQWLPAILLCAGLLCSSAVVTQTKLLLAQAN